MFIVFCYLLLLICCIGCFCVLGWFCAVFCCGDLFIVSVAWWCVLLVLGFGVFKYLCVFFSFLLVVLFWCLIYVGFSVWLVVCYSVW